MGTCWSSYQGLRTPRTPFLTARIRLLDALPNLFPKHPIKREAASQSLRTVNWKNQALCHHVHSTRYTVRIKSMLVKLNGSVTCPSSLLFNFLLLNVLQFLYWTFFDILPQEMLAYLHAGVNKILGKSQTVNISSFVSVATTPSATVAKKQPDDK